MEYMVKGGFDIDIIKNRELDKFVTTGKYVTYRDIFKTINKLYPDSKFYLANFSKRFRTCYLNFIADNNKRIVLSGYVRGDVDNVLMLVKLMGEYREDNNGRIIINKQSHLTELSFHLYEYQIFIH